MKVVKIMMSLTEHVNDLYNISSCDDLTEFPMSIRREYYKTGNRQNFEKIYFRRRDFLSSCAFLALSDDTYISQLENIILAICDEYCWALPAHTYGTKENDSKTIDLFVAETAFTLAEICTVFENKLSTDLKNRVKYEVENRLVKNYLNQKYWWEDCTMNWASVCGGFTGGTLIYLFPEEFKNQESRILKTLQCYIDGFLNDGVCLEGADYWLYGFSAFVYFADLLFDFTNGKIDLFQDEKVRKIAGYIEKIFLKGNTVVSFSDANANVKADMALQYYLSRKMPESVSLLPVNRMSIWGGNTKWPCFYRTLLWVDGRKVNSEKYENHISENQIIINKKNYSIAIKGGNNDEPHNHNDIGSFILSDENGQVFCDLGAGRYTKDYFNENRYSIFCNSSLSHNVPIINGKGQKSGKEYIATLAYNENKVVTDITKAYNENKLKSFIRCFEFSDNSIFITDELKSKNSISVTERFVTLRKPEIKENTVFLGNTCIVFDKGQASLEINEEYHIPHEYDTDAITVFCLDFILKKETTEITFEIQI